MIALVWNDDAGAADFAISQNDLLVDEGLETDVMASLFEDRQAEPGDVLPDGDTDRRGWWGDSVPVVDGDRRGSRLWLLNRSKETPDVLSRAEEYAREALQWLLTDKVASEIEVSAEFFQGRGYVLTVKIHRPGKDPASYRFGRAWIVQEARH